METQMPIICDYRPRTGVACMPRHSPVVEFTVLLYQIWAWGGGEAECMPIIVAVFDTHAHLDCHLATGVLPDGRTTTHDADHHTAQTNRQKGLKALPTP